MVTAKEIPPGGVGEVKATFKSKGFQGKVKKSVTVETNDPDNPRVSLSLQGGVVSEVMITPRYVNFRNVTKYSSPQPVPLTITLREGKGLKIEEVSVDNPSVILKEEKRSENSTTYAVSLAEKVSTGRLTGKILVKTNSRKAPKWEVPFYAFVQGSVKVSPQLLSFGVVNPGQSSTVELTLTGAGDEGFAVDKVTATAEAITTEILPEKDGKVCLIRVTYNPGDKTKGRISERLTILVKGEEEEILEVPVYGTIQPPRAKKNP